MKLINILERENRETALIRATSLMARIAQYPLTRASAAELRRLSTEVADLTEVA